MRESGSIATAVVLSLLLSYSARFIESAGEGGSDRRQSLNSEWQILTKQNFYSEIRLHPHILLMVTIPWSGEARSLMKQIGKLVADQPEKLNYLRLMVVYKNSQKMIADVLGAADEITLFYYHQSTSYKYHGSFAAERILSSVNYFMSLKYEEVPLKPLLTQNEVEDFLKSTDKAVLLIDLCGWSSKLLPKKSNENFTLARLNYLKNDDINGAKLFEKIDENLPSSTKKTQKGLENGGLSCGVENEMPVSYWHGEFCWANSSVLKEMQYEPADVINLSCTDKEFERFETFFSNFKMVAREFFLSPEMMRFGVISERSLLQYVSVDTMKAWLVMLQFNGCPSCSMILEEGDDLKKILQERHPPVMQLDVNGHALQPVFPANVPSVVLFIDRLSESQVIREKSKLALDSFRKLEEHYRLSYSMNRGVHHGNPQSHTVQASPVSDPSSLYFRREYATPRILKIKDNMDTVINKGQKILSGQAASYAEGNAIYNALLDFINKRKLNRKKETKLSLLAKENGFQLLSDDFEVQVIDSSSTYYEERDDLSDGNKDAVTSQGDQSSELHQPPNKVYANKNDELSTVIEEPTVYEAREAALGDAEDDVQKYMEHIQPRPFQCSFFFLDGGYRLLNSLTGRSFIPSLVIVDPVEQHHFDFTGDRDFDLFSLIDFMEKFLNGSLSPYQPSATFVLNPKEAPRPPFVNLDFHEIDAIPRVTTNAFCELVYGFNPCDGKIVFPTSQVQNMGPAWKTDVLVLFGSSYCGFCLRMELLVREVYQAFKNLKNMLTCESSVINSVCFEGTQGDVTEYSLPSILLMDCVQNDCGSFLKTVGRKELYPELMLYSAQNKSAIPYEGDMLVVNIIKFLLSQGRNSQHLIKFKGFLWKHSSKNITKKTMPHDAAPFLITKREANTITLADSPVPESFHNSKAPVAPGFILSATDRLREAIPFENSTILITFVDEGQAFQGIILNKPIKWDVFENLGDDMEFIKRAPLFYGGPVRAQGLPLVSLTRKFTEGFMEVIDGVYFGNPIITSMVIEGIKSGDRSGDDYWFFLGYCGWNWMQFFNELDEGDWDLSADTAGSLNWPLLF